MTVLERTVEALLFLSPQPVSTAELAQACDASEAEVDRALDALEGNLAEGSRGLVLRQVAGGYTLAADPVAEEAARRLLSTPRTPPLTQAQAETLAIVSYLQPVSRPEIARIRGVASESAVATLTERGLAARASGRWSTGRRSCSRSCSASPASTSCRTRRGSTRPPRTSGSSASAC
jgi:segregation and condensation protein B